MNQEMWGFKVLNQALKTAERNLVRLGNNAGTRLERFNTCTKCSSIQIKVLSSIC
jgi:hypothetical protein